MHLYMPGHEPCMTGVEFWAGLYILGRPSCMNWNAVELNGMFGMRSGYYDAGELTSRRPMMKGDDWNLWNSPTRRRWSLLVYWQTDSVVCLGAACLSPWLSRPREITRSVKQCLHSQSPVV